MTDRTGPDRDWWTYAGLALPAATAVALSFAAWSGLAVQVGVDQQVGPVRLAWLLPLSVDAIGVTATRVWVMDRTVTERTRALARRTALATIGLSFAGNALFHLVTVLGMRAWSAWWVVVVLVTGLPAVLYFASAHLIVRLRTDQRSTVYGPQTVDPPSAAGLATTTTTHPAGPAAPKPSVRTPVPARPTKTTERLAIMRGVWPDQTPTKDQIKTHFGIAGDGGANALRKAHEDWLTTEHTEPTLHAVK